MAMPPLPTPPGGQTGAAPPSPGPEPRRKRRWVRVVTGVIVVAVSMVVGAAITYALTRTEAGAPPQGTPSAAESTPTSNTPAYSAAEREKAKQRVCNVFDASVRHQSKRGPMVDENGDPNIPAVVRKLGSVAAVEHALTPATPNDIVVAARRYTDSQLDLITATMGYAAADELNRLTGDGNDATYALDDLCGLEH